MRILRLLCVALVAAVLLQGCSMVSDASLGGLHNSGASEAEPYTNGADIALITTEERLSSDFGQSVWGSMSRFAGESGLSLATYKTEEGDAEAALSTLQLAIMSGAQLVVAMDTTATDAIAGEALRHPETAFILLDASRIFTGQNITTMNFSAGQAGWLAGYVAMQEQRGTLGLVCDGSEMSDLYALSFTLGAEAAARELGFTPETAGVLVARFTAEMDDEARKALVSSLFEWGAGVAFAADCALQQLTAECTRQAFARMVALDLEPDHTNYGVMARVKHEPGGLVYEQLLAWQEGGLTPGVVTGTVKDGAVTLELDPEAMQKAGKYVLQRAVAKFADGTLERQLATALLPTEEGTLPTPEALETEYLFIRPPGPQETGAELPTPAADPPVSSQEPQQDDPSTTE